MYPRTLIIEHVFVVLYTLAQEGITLLYCTYNRYVPFLPVTEIQNIIDTKQCVQRRIYYYLSNAAHLKIGRGERVSIEYISRRVLYPPHT